VRRVLGALAVLLVIGAARAAAQEDAAGRLVVRGVAFDGNQAIDDFQLSISIATTQSSAFQRRWFLRWLGLGERRFFDEREFRRDVLRIKALYLRSGFVDVQVDTLVRREEGSVWVRFRIDEGAPVVVRTLRVEGTEGVVPEERLLPILPLRLGRPFDRRLVRASADTIRTYFRDRGHAFVEVFTAFDEDRAARTAHVTFTVEPGIPVVVGDVRIEGAEKISPDVVRRLLDLQRGDRYSERRAYESQIELYRLNVYNHVSLTLVDSQPPPDSAVTIRVRLTEGPLHRLRLGAGYGTIDCFRGVGQWTANDFLGGGRQFLVNTRVTRVGAGDPLAFEDRVCPGLRGETPQLLVLNYNVGASLREPWLFSRRTSGAISVFGERRSEFQAYLREAAGGDVTLTQQLALNTPLTLSYSLIRGKTVAEPAKFCAFLNVCFVEDTIFSQPRLTSRIAVGLVSDNRSSSYDPVSGSVWSAEVALAHRAVGSDSLSQFLRGFVEQASYHRLRLGQVFSWRVRLGAVVAPQLDLAAGRGQYVPPEERFYAGGTSTVRGFSQNELGPVVRVLQRVDTVMQFDTVATAPTVVVDTLVAVDSLVRTSPVGGRGVILVNAEYRFTVGGFGNRLAGALFVDAGQVFERAEDVYRFWEMRVTPGFGIRIASPLGPIRADLALNLYSPQAGVLYVEDPPGRLREALSDYAPQKGTLGKLRFHVAIGQAF
jgi:outer membrane protein assembly factor BamA